MSQLGIIHSGAQLDIFILSFFRRVVDGETYSVLIENNLLVSPSSEWTRYFYSCVRIYSERFRAHCAHVLCRDAVMDLFSCLHLNCSSSFPLIVQVTSLGQVF